ncbi:hypothetical protein FH972_021722 [Carpinus fangiana]|uniref:Enoyl reductase (ER) domain-containing protein n=1 Tax=Carpinus fangiana TaxID=176857 RepID=A0A5N6KQH5_9ROSI|nr:hypothetical protein FH972_021722 [Carpinus fangiana]
MPQPSMKAVVIRAPGGPDVLKIESLPIPTAHPGRVLIRVKAFGLNRSEMFTRQGHSPGVKFPRVLGIEAVGIVEELGEGVTGLAKGDKVATAMGGIGRDFDGGYAEYTCPPATQVQRIETSLPWEVLGALPEMIQTAWGSLYKALRLQRGEHLLVRGGTTSVGLAAAALAKQLGATVSSTSRSAGRADFLKEGGADHVFVDDGNLANEVRKTFPDGVDKVLELIGVTTLEDSMACVKIGGIVCMTGIVGNKWSFSDFNPMEKIPNGVCLTSYSGGSDDFMTTPLGQCAKHVESGALKVHVGKVFNIDDIVEAHRCMDENKAGGKIVVLT